MTIFTIPNSVISLKCNDVILRITVDFLFFIVNHMIYKNINNVIIQIYTATFKRVMSKIMNNNLLQ